jgi:hypothetical protein
MIHLMDNITLPAITKLKKNKSLGIHQIPAELIQAGGET